LASASESPGSATKMLNNVAALFGSYDRKTSLGLRGL
jgi:hypothetical protein